MVGFVLPDVLDAGTAGVTTIKQFGGTLIAQDPRDIVLLIPWRTLMHHTDDAPDPRLRSLDPLVGAWDLHHRDLSTGETWGGRDQFVWMDGGFFLMFHHEEFGRNIKGTMIIGFERRWAEERFSDKLIGHWFESSTGSHFVYYWEVDDQIVRFSLEEPGSANRFLGRFNDDRSRIEGEWHLPDGSAYALTMMRVSAS